MIHSKKNVLYSTKSGFFGSYHRWNHFWCCIASNLVLQWFFTGSLADWGAYISPLLYTEPVKILYGSSVVLWHDWGYIAPLPYTEPVKLLYVLQWFFGMTMGLYSTATIYRPVKLLYGSSVFLWHDWGLYIHRLLYTELLSSCMVLQVVLWHDWCAI